MLGKKQKTMPTTKSSGPALLDLKSSAETMIGQDKTNDLDAGYRFREAAKKAADKKMRMRRLFKNVWGWEQAQYLIEKNRKSFRQPVWGPIGEKFFVQPGSTCQ